MSYKVLYRKYRPTAFNKIVGQANIVQILKESVIENTFAHAYLFTGPRGTGKTSTAKVLAKALTCQHPKDGEACNECENCKNFSTSPDIIEIDAASNNGVGEIRELRTNITLAPTSSKFKIYIIDEVHMLSTGAFNALLKTLEEPPAHAIFILATTEVYKVPITILSRCQRYDFKKIEKSEMVEHLKSVCLEEKIEFEEDALVEIYELSEGCLRDALSILDQTSKFSKKLSLDAILDSYNIISNNKVLELLEKVTQNDVQAVVEIIEDFENTGMNAQKLIKRMIGCFEKQAIDAKIKKDAKYPFKLLSYLINGLNRCYIDARVNENVFTMIKLTFLEAIAAPAFNSAPVLNSETKPVQSQVPTPPSTTEKPAPKELAEEPKDAPKVASDLSIEDIRINNCFVGVKKECLASLVDKWPKVFAKSPKGIELGNYTPVAASDTYAIFTSEEDSLAHLFNIKSEDIEKLLKRKDLEIKVISISVERWQQEREKYKQNLKLQKKYEYIEEPQKEDGSELKKEIDSLFTEKVVEIS